MLVGDVLRLVSGVLQDLEPGIERRWKWSGGEEGRIGLLDLMNTAVLAVALHRPDATASTLTVQLESGVRQELPPKALTLMALTRNMGIDGYTPGKPIGIMSEDVLFAMTALVPAAAHVEQYAYDRTTRPRVFWVYPAVREDAEVWVEMTISANPREVKTPDEQMPVADTYAQAIVHHMLAAIFSGDNEESSAGKAQFHVSMWNGLMGIKQSVDGQWPKTRSVAS